MWRELVGPCLVVAFVVSQALRDVYFGAAFQGIDFFVVILIAFSISAVVFAVVTFIRDRGAYAKMRGELAALAWMNATTALAWCCYFFSLKYLQPSIVNCLHAGAAPLTVVALASCGIHIARPSPVRPAEYGWLAGLAAALALLGWVVLNGYSGLRSESALGAFAPVLPLVSGTAITVSLLWCKRLNERGIGSDALSATRYLLIVVVAALVVVFGDRPSGVETLRAFAVLTVVTTLLVAAPLYVLQLGIARTAPLTVHLMRSLGPVLVFAAELADGRIAYSGLTLLGIALYSVFAIGGNLAHISHTRCGLRQFKKPTGQEPRAARCGSSGKRGDAPRRLLQPALRVALGRASPASGGSTVCPDTLSPPDAVSASPKAQRRPHGV